MRLASTLCCGNRKQQSSEELENRNRHGVERKSEEIKFSAAIGVALYFLIRDRKATAAASSLCVYEI